jgi:hypothetical protein
MDWWRRGARFSGPATCLFVVETEKAANEVARRRATACCCRPLVAVGDDGAGGHTDRWSGMVGRRRCGGGRPHRLPIRTCCGPAPAVQGARPATARRASAVSTPLRAPAGARTRPQIARRRDAARGPRGRIKARDVTWPRMKARTAQGSCRRGPDGPVSGAAGVRGCGTCIRAADDGRRPQRPARGLRQRPARDGSRPPASRSPPCAAGDGTPAHGRPSRTSRTSTWRVRPRCRRLLALCARKLNDGAVRAALTAQPFHRRRARARAGRTARTANRVWTTRAPGQLDAQPTSAWR